ncbi:unnamed protein product [Clonostachys rhizophaga]|uniref:Transcription factor domain-containing protein n=1 Tax=Clonostachys rhizophaga TaxID=160324 RepID=A0A9N9V8D2_9HYPO|nr:unnamed protein product [Clonostachys rhizophaga]
MRDKAATYCGILVTILRQSGRLSAGRCLDVEHPNQSDSLAVLEGKWERWVEAESFKRYASRISFNYEAPAHSQRTLRLVYRLLIHSAQEAAYRLFPPSLSYAEVSVTFPAAPSLWQATSATEWRDRYLHCLRDPVRGTLAPVNLHDCLRKPAHFDLFPVFQDCEFALMCVLHGVMTLSLEENRRRVVLGGNLATPTLPGCLFNLDATSGQSCHLSRLASEVRLLWGKGNIPKSSTAVIIRELGALHRSTPLNEMQFLIECLDQRMIIRTLVGLRQWRLSSEARRAVWHAGQIWRIVRVPDNIRPAAFLVIAAWQAMLCLWMYCGLSDGGLLQGAFPSLAWPSLSTWSNDEDSQQDWSSPCVHIDSDPTAESEQWLECGVGFPAISFNEPLEDGSETRAFLPLVPLRMRPGEAKKFGHEVARLARDRFSSDGGHIAVLDGICEIFYAMGRYL